MSVTAATGFVASGVAAGIRRRDRKDLAIVRSVPHAVGAAMFNGDLHRRARLPEVKPISRRHANATPEAPAPRWRPRRLTPKIEACGPVVKALSIGIGVPALAQRDGITPKLKRGLVDRLLERERHRWAAGTAKRRARRRVADDVEVGEMLRLGGIDETSEAGDGRVHACTGIGIGIKRHGFERAIACPQQRQLDVSGRSMARDR